MVLTVTLNPAVDKTCYINELLLGQVNRLQEVMSIAGGKGVNVTKVLRQFECPVVAMGFIGGYTGKLIQDRLMEMGAECHFTHIEQATRVSTNILADNGYVTEVLEPGPTISEEEMRRFLSEYKRQLQRVKMVVLSGSIPKGVPENIYETLTVLAKEAGCKVFLDTSGEALKMGVKAVPYFLKPNKRELEYLVGRKLSSTQDIKEQVQALLNSGVEKVVVSLGAKGFLYGDKEGIIEQKPVKVKAVNTVACGDCLVASFCMSEADGMKRKTAVYRAVALASANAATTISAQIPMELYLKFTEDLQEDNK